MRGDGMPEVIAKVAVENAADELKAKADFITECNDRDGVVKYILKTLF